jgi:hypothetical protein
VGSHFDRTRPPPAAFGGTLPRKQGRDKKGYCVSS